MEASTRVCTNYCKLLNRLHCPRVVPYDNDGEYMYLSILFNLRCSKSAPPTSAQQPHPLVQSIVAMSSELDCGLDFADANQQDHQQP